MGIQEFSDATESLFIWDDVEKKGFPLTDSVSCVDLSKLSHEDRLIIAGSNALEISELVAREGGLLSGLLEMSVRVFRGLLQEIYNNETEEKKKEIQELVRKFLDRGIDEI
jgi:hypothetical protein